MSKISNTFLFSTKMLVIRDGIHKKLVRIANHKTGKNYSASQSVDLEIWNERGSVILLPAHPASFVHNFVSGMQSFYFSQSQDAIVLQTCH